MRPLIITCPCCKNELDIDRETGQIVRIGSKKGTKDFDAIVDSVKSKQREDSSQFDQLTRAVKGREAQLDDVFQSAFEKVRETDDGEKPFNPLDFD